MKSEADAITDDEWLLRRVHKNRFRTDRAPIISRSAFEPRINGRDPDTDGISLYRAECLSSAEECLAPVAPEKRSEYAVVRIRVRTLLDLGLTVVRKTDERVSGHVVIPQLNAKVYAGNKSQFTATLLSLAKSASDEENIIIRPTESG